MQVYVKEGVEHFCNTSSQEKIGSSWQTRKVAQMLLGGILKYNRLYSASVRRVRPQIWQGHVFAHPLLCQGSFEKNPAV